MKALSLWQPWASLVAIGAKTIETRHWSTRYRGPLAIHAAKHIDSDLPEYLGPYWCMVDKGGCLIREGGTGPVVADHPLGTVVATCELVDVVPMVPCSTGGPEGLWLHWDGAGGPVDRLRLLRVVEGAGIANDVTDQIPFGDFKIGRFAWVLENIRPLPPVTVAGHQGLWNWTHDPKAAFLADMYHAQVTAGGDGDH